LDPEQHRMNKPFSQLAIERIAAQGYSAPRAISTTFQNEWRRKS
jgi:hypothetical protein